MSTCIYQCQLQLKNHININCNINLYTYIYNYIPISTSISIYININITSTYLLHFPLTSLRCSEFPARKRMRSCHSTAGNLVNLPFQAVMLVLVLLSWWWGWRWWRRWWLLYEMCVSTVCVDIEGVKTAGVWGRLSASQLPIGATTRRRGQRWSQKCAQLCRRDSCPTVGPKFWSPHLIIYEKTSLVSGGLCSTALPFDTHLYVLECVSISNVLSSSQPSIFPASSFVAVGCSWTLPWPIARVFWRSSVCASDVKMLSVTTWLHSHFSFFGRNLAMAPHKKSWSNSQSSDVAWNHCSTRRFGGSLPQIRCGPFHACN